MVKPYAIAIVIAVVAALIGVVQGSPLLYAIVGFTLVVCVSNQRKLAALMDELAELRRIGPMRSPTAAAQKIESAPSATPEPDDSVSHVDEPPSSAAMGRGWQGEAPDDQSRASGGRLQELINGAIAAIVSWTTGGNIFMRVGIVLLFLGVGFLINYAAGLGIITIEMRMIATAVAAIVGLVVGQRLLKRKRDYALMLQGAAIGVLYLDIFGSFSVYELIPGTLAFALLFAVSALAALLAVVQNAAPLAYAGFAGGFLAPILASSGSGNYVGLFSYYVVLNLALLGIAWFKSWRPLNLLGFYFTFGVAALWGYQDYSVDKYPSVQPFLLVFFVIYACIPILYARRQPVELRGYVDGSLLFGTSVIAFALQLKLTQSFAYGAAWSAFGFGTFYVAVAALLWRRNAEDERLLVEVFVALGVVFATLVIPFALGASDTAGAWALEGAGLIWIGMRQNRALARLAGIVLQLGAAGFWLDHLPSGSATMFFNSSYLAGVMLALAAFFSAGLYRRASGPGESKLQSAFIVWFVIWWSGIGCREILTFVPDAEVASWLVAFGALSSVVITLVASRWNWARMQAVALLGVLAYVAALGQHLLFAGGPLHEHLGWLLWPVGALAYYWVLRRGEDRVMPGLLSEGHVVATLLVLGVLQWEVYWLVSERLNLHVGWQFSAIGAMNIVALQCLHRINSWPVTTWLRSYRGVVASIVSLFLGCMIIIGFTSSGEAPPLPWLPVLNPFDAVAIVGVLCLATVWLDLEAVIERLSATVARNVAWVCLALAGFTWLNVTLFRALHHWVGIPYDLGAMMQSSLAQTSMTLLWVALGMGVVILASRRGLRSVWLSGGALLVVVVAKLFMEDLANTDTLARIVSFLGVGIVLILIGYFSPLPPKKAVQE